MVFSWMIAVQMLAWADVTDDFREDGYIDPLANEAEEDLMLEKQFDNASRDLPPSSNEERLDRMLEKKNSRNVGGLV